MFNFSGSEMVFLLLLALIVLGPEKLPDAVRKFGKTYAEFKKMSTGFQSELRSALDEPMKEMRETADILKNAANFDAVSDSMKPTSGTMAPATPATPAQAVQPPFRSTDAGGSTASGGSAQAEDAPAAAPAPVERPPGPAFHSAAPPRREPPVPEPVAEPAGEPVAEQLAGMDQATPDRGQEEPTA